MKRFIILAEYKTVTSRDDHLKVTTKKIPVKWFIGDTKKVTKLSSSTNPKELAAICRGLNQLNEDKLRDNALRN